MAKQAVDKVTKEIELAREWEKVSAAKTQIGQIGGMLDGYEKEWNRLLQRKSGLEALGVDWAGTWMKDDRFLYLVYPVDENGKRARVYVGADKDKQEAALGKLQRGQEVDEIKKALARIERMVDNIQYELNHILRGW